MIVHIQTIGEPETFRLLRQLEPQIDSSGELVLLEEAHEGFMAGLKLSGLHYSTVHLELPYSYAAARNEIFKYAEPNEWIITLDPDECIDPNFLSAVRAEIEANPDVELFWLPRVNLLHDGSESEPPPIIWSNPPKVANRNIMAYPDYQGRVYKNTGRLQWKGMVHEQIRGAVKEKRCTGKELTLIHHKRHTTYHELALRRQVKVKKIIGGTPEADAEFDQVFCRNSFNAPPWLSGSTILDTTAGHGAFAALCLERIATRVVCYEPDPMKFQKLKALADAAQERIEIHNSSVGDLGAVLRSLRPTYLKTDKLVKL